MLVLVKLQDGSVGDEVQLHLVQTDGTPVSIEELQADVREAVGDDDVRVLGFSVMEAECQAATALEQIVEGMSRRYPRLSEGITLRARFLEQTGEREAAAQAYREALRVNPGDVAAREGLRRLAR